MSELMHGRRVVSFQVASTGRYENAEGMYLTWEGTATDAEGWETAIHPFIRWDQPDGTTVLVNLRHVENLTLAPQEVPNDE